MKPRTPRKLKKRAKKLAAFLRLRIAEHLRTAQVKSFVEANADVVAKLSHKNSVDAGAFQ